jgi:FkbM family methyltransferase
MQKQIYSLFLKASDALSDKGITNIPGLTGLHKALYRIIEPKGIIQIHVQGSKMYVNSRDKAIVHSLITKGIWEEFETELISKLIKPGDTVVDIGANIGYYTLIAAKTVGNDGRVYSFEPEPNNYELLVKNVKINDYTNAITVQKALSNKRGKLTLFMDKTNFGAHSLSQKNIISQKGGFVTVETTTLDDFFGNFEKDSKIDFIKMDAEGAEGLIVEGAQGILKQNKIKILMEFWVYGLKNLGTDPSELLHDLQDRGFKIKLIDDKKRCLRQTEIKDIVQMCQNTSKGMVEINLLLEK